MSAKIRDFCPPPPPQVASLHMGLDRCAALINDILQSETSGQIRSVTSRPHDVCRTHAAEDWCSYLAALWDHSDKCSKQWETCALWNCVASQTTQALTQQWRVVQQSRVQESNTWETLRERLSRKQQCRSVGVRCLLQLLFAAVFGFGWILHIKIYIFMSS